MEDGLETQAKCEYCAPALQLEKEHEGLHYEMISDDQWGDEGQIRAKRLPSSSSDSRID